MKKNLVVRTLALPSGLSFRHMASMQMSHAGSAGHALSGAAPQSPSRHLSPAAD